jgi:hypothetical protein
VSPVLVRVFSGGGTWISAPGQGADGPNTCVQVQIAGVGEADIGCTVPK